MNAFGISAGSSDLTSGPGRQMESSVGARAARVILSLSGVALVTFVGYSRIPINATSAALAYLLVILIVASLCGFLEASVASFAATICFNLFFLPPVGTLTIADPQNWVALFTFLTTALVTSRLSAEARRQASDAVARQVDVERLYTFSRSILLIEPSGQFAKQLLRRLVETFRPTAAVLFERRSNTIYQEGWPTCEGVEKALRDAALQGQAFNDAQHNVMVVAVRLGTEPIAGLALQGVGMPDSVLQGIANLVAIGLERARAQDLEAQIEAVRQSEKLRTSLLDAMAHEFKTPLTSVMAATSSLLVDPEQPLETRRELLRIADEEAHHLNELIEDAVEMGRLDTANIEVHAEPSDVTDIVREIVGALRPELNDRTVSIKSQGDPAVTLIDRRLVKLAVKQIVDNALKYSPASAPVEIQITTHEGLVSIEVTDHGPGIDSQEQDLVFDRMYRSPSVRHRVPGSGLGLNIAQNIARAHGGDLTLTSEAGLTKFCMTLPIKERGDAS